MAAAEPVIPPFPVFPRVKIVIAIDGEKMTLWPQRNEKWWEKVLGSPLELRFFAKDYLWISSDGRRVEIQPHYLESTFDTFWVDTRGVVKAQALGGLFPFTLGKQRQLLRGIVATLGALPNHLKKKDERLAATLRAIHAYLAGVPEQDAPEGDRPKLGRPRAAVSHWVWGLKLRRFPLL